MANKTDAGNSTALHFSLLSLTEDRMITAEEALVRACNLAHDYRSRSMSPIALMAESGYRVHRRELDVEKIRKHVAAHPKLISDWMGYSENKRVSSGWYFHDDSVDGLYVVGCISANNSATTRRKYSDDVEACAFYIKQELESIVS